MAENLLSDARVRTATFERDGSYLPDGGGLRIRLLPPSRNHQKGARLAEYHFKIKRPDGTYLNGALHLGTIGDPFTDHHGKTRPFTLADARAARNAARDLVGQGIDPREHARLEKRRKAEAVRQELAALDGRQSVRTAFAEWQRLYVAAHRKDGGDFVQGLFDRHILPAIGDVPLPELTAQRITSLLADLAGSGRRRTANVALSTLRQYVRWCIPRGWLDTDPTLLLKKEHAGGREKTRARNLTTMEIVELRDRLPTAKLPERLERAVWVLLATGARVSELAGARIEHFDFDAKTWHIPETKTGAPHLVHLSDFAAGHLRRMVALAGKSPYLLPARDPAKALDDKALTKALADRQRLTPLKGRSKRGAASLRLAGGEWRPHDLRRTMASRMRDMRIPGDVIERCLNHTLQGVSAIYQRTDLMDERKAAFEAWGAELDRLMVLDVSNVATLRSKAA